MGGELHGRIGNKGNEGGGGGRGLGRSGMLLLEEEEFSASCNGEEQSEWGREEEEGSWFLLPLLFWVRRSILVRIFGERCHKRPPGMKKRGEDKSKKIFKTERVFCRPPSSQFRRSALPFPLFCSNISWVTQVGFVCPTATKSLMQNCRMGKNFRQSSKAVIGDRTEGIAVS